MCKLWCIEFTMSSPCFTKEKLIPAEKSPRRCDAAPALQWAQLRCVLKTPVQKGYWPADSKLDVKNIEK